MGKVIILVAVCPVLLFHLLLLLHLLWLLLIIYSRMLITNIMSYCSCSLAISHIYKSLVQTSIHGSCAVIRGEKWVATKWIRDQEMDE